MISYFPEMYKDELLYSIIGRYGKYNCQSCRGTLFNIFGDYNTLPTIEFPCNLGNLLNTISCRHEFEVEYLISNHTMYPYYYIFLPTKRQESIKNKMISGDGKAIKTEIGFIAGSLCRKLNLYYCSECAKEEILINGEAYFHRLHQAQGVCVCIKHNTLLLEYPIRLIDESRLSYITIESENLNFSENKLVDGKLLDVRRMLAASAEFLLLNDLSHLNKDILHKAYLNELKKKDLTTISGRIHQIDLCKAMECFYGDEILTIFESRIDANYDYNWIKVLTRNEERIVHPIRHILFINFLVGDIENFVDSMKEVKKERESVYPCLNPTSNHYRQFVIKNVKITADYKTRKPIGTFYCDCGFTYSRRMDGNKYKIGRIKEFGKTWEDKLQSLIMEQKYTITDIAKELCCDYKTVVKYADKLGLKHFLKTRMSIKYTFNSKDGSRINNTLVEYKSALLKYINCNPNTTYCRIRSIMPREFNYVYKYDREWIKKNIPRKDSKISSAINCELWMKRDEEYFNQMSGVFKGLLMGGTRITRTLLIRKIGKQATIEKNLDKLPLCNDFLENINNKLLH